MKYTMTKPCDNCPFRRDIHFRLHPERARQIASALLREDKTFTCHKTTVPDDDGGMRDGPNAQHCAGALIFLEHNGRPNRMPRIAAALGLYDHRKLDMSAPVVRSMPEFIAQQRG